MQKKVNAAIITKIQYATKNNEREKMEWLQSTHIIH